MTILSSIDESIRAKVKLKDQVRKLEEMAKMGADTIKGGGKILLFGNGGSAADAQHIAAEFVGLPVIALTTNSSMLTAIGNDCQFYDVFSLQVLGLCRKGDVVVGISTSGWSKDVLEGMKAAKKLGAKTVGLTGKDGGALKDMVDLAIVVESDSTARIQECHILIGHVFWEQVSELLREGLGRTAL